MIEIIVKSKLELKAKKNKHVKKKNVFIDSFLYKKQFPFLSRYEYCPKTGSQLQNLKQQL